MRTIKRANAPIINITGIKIIQIKIVDTLSKILLSLNDQMYFDRKNIKKEIIAIKTTGVAQSVDLEISYGITIVKIAITTIGIRSNESIFTLDKFLFFNIAIFFSLR